MNICRQHIQKFVTAFVGRALARQSNHISSPNIDGINANLQGIFKYLVFAFCALNFNASAFSPPPLRIAVSSNFTPVLKVLLVDFEAQTNIKAQIISGGTGTLFLQIKHGAPFDIFISADSTRPQQLEQDNLTIKASRKTYALGQLALYSGQKDLTRLTLQSLNTPPKRFAIANPDTAPYGKAAKETLQHLGVWSLYQDKLITGMNVNQTFTQVRSQAVQRGLVAYSQLVFYQLNGVVIPQSYHQPIEQQLVIIKASHNIAQAKQLASYLLSPAVQQKIMGYGYLVNGLVKGATHDKS